MNFEDAIKKIKFLVKNEDYLIVKTLGNNSEFKIKVEDDKIYIVNSGDSSILVDKIFWDKVVDRMSVLEEDKKYKGTYYTITHWSNPENPNTLFSPTIPAIIRKLEGKEKIDYVLKNSKNNNLKYVIAIAVIFCLFLFFKVLHEDSVKENDLNSLEGLQFDTIQPLPYVIKGNTAIIDISFDRTRGSFPEVIDAANNTVKNSADLIKEVMNNNPNLEKIVLKIHTTCEDDYGYNNTHIDEIIFNTYEISEFRKYNRGENIAYGCSLYYHKLAEFWNTCGPNPSSLVY